ncbi:MAG: nucleotidyltransferase family protein [Brevinematales bacterium]|nr:nucleotidyltransferase family protein [Brevinematales bacterium]
MKRLEEIMRILSERKQFLEREYHIREIGVFGSYVNGNPTQESDLDVLVSFSEMPGLLEFCHIQNELGDMLDVKIDLVLKDTLKPYIGTHILDEVKYL